MQNAQHSTSSTFHTTEPISSGRSAVSWGAVLAGAVIAVAVSAMLITGGTGLGFLAVSPWSNEGASGSAIAVGTIAWLFAAQIIAYGVAGYVTGRLRTRWSDAARDEIFFRDTAHGFLVWALSTVVGLAVLGSALGAVASGTAKAGAALAGAGAGAVTAVAGQAVQGGDGAASLNYFADALLRPEDPAQAAGNPDVRQEVGHIFARSIAQGEVAEADKAYLTKLIAQRAGVDEATAQRRITELADQARKTAEQAEQKAREAADAARKAAAAFSLWAFAALLIGAFVASLAATVGGRARDR